MADVIVFVLLVLVIGSACLRIHVNHKKGRKCLGCPSASSCSSCSGSCVGKNCSDFKKPKTPSSDK